jgi:hypothetical protein
MTSPYSHAIACIFAALKTCDMGGSGDIVVVRVADLDHTAKALQQQIRLFRRCALRTACGV